MKLLNILFFAMFLFSGILLAAQPPCQYEKKMEQGKALYEKGQYLQAKYAFENAGCRSLTASQRKQTHEWYNKCLKKLKEQKKQVKKASKVSSTTPSENTSTTVVVNTPPPPPKPEAKVTSTDYLAATCNNSLRGAKLSVIVETKNLQDKKITIRLALAPVGGGDKPKLTDWYRRHLIVDNDEDLHNDMLHVKWLKSHEKKATELLSQYTLPDGKLGQELVFDVTADEDYITAEFFVPFCVMDFDKNEIDQSFSTVISVFQNDNNQLLSKFEDVFEELRTFSLTFKGSTSDCQLTAGADGASLDINDFVGCHTDNSDIVIFDLPNWMELDRNEEVVRIKENPYSNERSATFSARSAIGGNTIAFTIRQKGAEPIPE